MLVWVVYRNVITRKTLRENKAHKRTASPGHAGTDRPQQTPSIRTSNHRWRSAPRSSTRPARPGPSAPGTGAHRSDKATPSRSTRPHRDRAPGTRRGPGPAAPARFSEVFAVATCRKRTPLDLFDALSPAIGRRCLDARRFPDRPGRLAARGHRPAVARPSAVPACPSPSLLPGASFPAACWTSWVSTPARYTPSNPWRIKTMIRVAIECDKCGQRSASVPNSKYAIYRLRAAWNITGRRDICPQCAKKKNPTHTG